MLTRPTCLFFTFFLLLSSTIPAQSSQKLHFADQALFGLHYGYVRGWENEVDNRYDVSQFWGPRAGLSLNSHLYAGIQARIVSARNFETPWQTFYMAGLWGRGYLRQPAITRWNFFLETGLLLGNYDFENKDFIEYYVRRAGRWYIPIILGGEFRLFRQLTVEGCLQTYYNSGRNWDQYGFGYASLGLNYYLGKK